LDIQKKLLGVIEYKKGYLAAVNIRVDIGGGHHIIISSRRIMMLKVIVLY